MPAVVQATDGKDNVRPQSGFEFERSVHEIVDRFAATWGDRYLLTGAIPGLLSKCKKGDGVLEILEPPIRGPRPRVVVEMTTDVTSRRDWFAYLDEAQRNRDAQAALGIILGSEVPGGGPIRSYGSGKIVIACDPEQSEQHLLEALLYTLRCQAIDAVARWRSPGTRAAGEDTTDLAASSDRKLDSIRIRFTDVQRSADKGLQDVEALRSELFRLVTAFLGELEKPDSEA